MEPAPFTVLCPLSPELPPPAPPPPHPRVAPRVLRASKDKSAFVILGEEPSGRTSPYRGRGFKPPPTRIPVLSAPSSPVKKQPPVKGKSAPVSPNRTATRRTIPTIKTPTAAKRVTTKPPGSPRRPQPTQRSDLRASLRRPSINASTDKLTVKSPADTLFVKSPTHKLSVKAGPDKLSVKVAPDKPFAKAATDKLNVKAATDKLNVKAATGKLTVKAATDKLTIVKAATDKLSLKVNPKQNEEIKSGSQQKKSDDPTPQVDDKVKESGNDTLKRKAKTLGKPTEKNKINIKLKSVKAFSSSIDKKNEKANEVCESKLGAKTGCEPKGDKQALSTKSNEEKSVDNNNTCASVNSSVKDDSKIVNGKNDITTIEITSGAPDAKGNDKTSTHVSKKNEAGRNANGDKGSKIDSNTEEKSKDSNNSKSGNIAQQKIIIHQGETNGVVKVVGSEPIQDQVMSIMEDGGKRIVTEALVSASEDGRTELGKWSSSGKQLAGSKAAQPDLIPPQEQTIEETGRVVGQAEAELEAANHSVTFRSPEIHPVTPRRKPIGICARIQERLSGCCKKPHQIIPKKRKPPKLGQNAINKKKPPQKKASFMTRLCPCFRKKNTATPQQPPPAANNKPSKNVEQKKEGGRFLSKLNCCCKRVKKNKVMAAAAPQPRPKAPKKKWWRTVFCLDRACCSKCKRGGKKGVPDANKKKEKVRKSSQDTGFPKLEQSLVDHTSMMKAAIPVLPTCLAWMCLILNVFLPGTGTITSGLLCLCFGKPRFSVNDSSLARFGSFCVNFMVGLSQIFTILFCLVGWGWSIWWGIIMLRIARKSRRIKLAEQNASQSAPPPVDPNRDVEQGQ